jgi:hypothetical protein
MDIYYHAYIHKSDPEQCPQPTNHATNLPEDIKIQIQSFFSEIDNPSGLKFQLFMYFISLILETILPFQ